MSASETGMVAAAKMPVRARKAVRSAEPGRGGAERRRDGEERERDGHHAQLAEAVGERTVEQLEEPEGQHVGGDEDARPGGVHGELAGDGREQRRDDPVVGHDDEAGQAEHEDQTLDVHRRAFRCSGMRR